MSFAVRCLVFALFGAQAQTRLELPDGFSQTKLAEGITGAVALAVAPDGRIFVCEQTGALRVVKHGALLPEPCVSLNVDSWWERGLIGVALDPAFPDRPYVYLNYISPDPRPHHKISRFTAAGDSAEPASEVVLFEGDEQDKKTNPMPGAHQGGALHFGQDGKLYIGIGDHRAGSPAQSLEALPGKILRINPDGTIPEDNPFFGKTRGKYRAIWALGLRNPFTFAFQPGTKRLFINDVGEATWEEINEGEAGANYGWPQAEGPARNPRFRDPIHAYGHGVGRSIAGGAFYNPPSPRFPDEYVGKYFFADYMDNWVRVLDPKNPKNVVPFARGFSGPVDLAVGPDGSLYVLNRNAWVKDDKFRPRTGWITRILWARDVPGAAAREPASPARDPSKARSAPSRESPGPFRFRAPPEKSPLLLSQTGLFRSLSPLVSSGTLVPYEVNCPVWADGAIQSRWVALPPQAKIRFREDGPWDVPPRTVLVRHLEIATAGGPVAKRKLETRVLVVGGPGGGYGMAYKWREDGLEADLMDGYDLEEIVVRDAAGQRKMLWFFPGRDDCRSCHSAGAGFVLGLRTGQLNRLKGPDDQLRIWNRLGMFEPQIDEDRIASFARWAPVADRSASLGEKVRSYLAANCAHCHRPGGTPAYFDARYETPLGNKNLIDGRVSTAALDIREPRVVAPGDLSRSTLYQRLCRTDAFRMPPLGRSEPDGAALAVLEEWIRGLGEKPK